jgi:hypothetical protein
MIGGDDDAGRGAGFGDYLTAHGAWRLIAFLTVGYMVARDSRRPGAASVLGGGSKAERGDDDR